MNMKYHARFIAPQVVATVLSRGTFADPDILAVNAASAALTLSDIPWGGPVGAIRVALVRWPPCWPACLVASVLYQACACDGF